MRIFITGATGFIGSWVAYRLLAAGHQLVALARDPRKLPALWSEPGVECLEGQLTDFGVIEPALVGCDACVHVALGWGETPTTMLAADTRVTAFLVEACARAGVGRFIYTSSTAVLGPFFSGMNELHPLRPDTLYGASKAAAEAFVMAAGAAGKMRCNIIRPGYTFGNPVVDGAPTQPDKRFQQLVEQAVAQQPVTIEAGDGTQFIWVGDLAKLYEAVLGSEHNREAYFALSVPFTSWEAIAQLAIQRAGSASEIVLTGKGQLPALFDLDKIYEHFGFRFNPTEQLRAHVAYWLQR